MIKIFIAEQIVKRAQEARWVKEQPSSFRTSVKKRTNFAEGRIPTIEPKIKRQISKVEMLVAKLEKVDSHLYHRVRRNEFAVLLALR